MKRHVFSLAVVAGVLCVNSLFTLAQSYQTTVYLKDGGLIQGVLIDMTPDAIRLNPSGPVSLRRLSATEIDSVRIDDLGRTYSYPLSLTDGSFPSSRTGRSRTAASPGFSRWAVTVATGMVSTGPEGEREYYEGFAGGPTVRIHARRYFSEPNPRSGRMFLDFSYGRSQPRPEERHISMGYHPQRGHLGTATIDLAVDHVGLGVGAASRMSSGGGFIFGLFGISYLSNKVSASAAVDGRMVSASERDAVGAIRFECGTVIGTGTPIGIELRMGSDFLYSGTEYDYMGKARPAFAGWLPNATVGAYFRL